MFGYIKGEITYRNEEGIILENNGIGYNIKMPLSAIDRLPSSDEEVKIYTYTYVKEDAFQLFGFLSMDELQLFRMLITVNGIGPKGGLAILSSMTVDELRFAILADDAKSIAKTPGIGAKTAGKLILELKDKLKLVEAVEEKLSLAEETGSISENDTAAEEARQALVALGYSATEAMKAVRAVKQSGDMSVEELLKQSLKYL